MRAYNTQTEQEKGVILREHLRKMARWYIKQYRDYNQTFQSELNMELADKEIYNMTKDPDLEYAFSFDAILTPFCVSDFLVKHILSTYSYGPETVSGNIIINPRFAGVSWFDYKGDAPTCVEFLQEYLNMNNEGDDLELGVLLEERRIRSCLTHAGSLEMCMSIIRFYNVIRKMFIFMDTEYEKELPEFVYPNSISCDIQGLMQHIDFDDFKNRTTILVIGSIHDIPKTYKALLSNIPWNVVIDYDANSENGGLRSAATINTINDRYWDLSIVNNISIRNNLTEWLKCGDFFYPTPKTDLKNTFINRTALDLGGYNNKQYYRWTNQMFDTLFHLIAGEQNPVSILFMYNDLDVLEEIIDNAEKHFYSVSYKLAAAYYWGEERREQLINHAYKDDIRFGSDYSDRFQMFPCNILSFFTGFSQYYTLPQHSSTEFNTYKLPGADGDMEVPINLRIRLEKYFDVLYVESGQEDYMVAREKIQDFHSGALAPWCAYEYNEVVNLLSEIDYDRWKNKIKSTLGRMQDAEKKIIHLVHRAGIGGTTMLRYLGWDLHKEYPVLVAQKYSRNEVRNVLQDLYDQQSKAFVVLVDEDYDDFDDLVTDIKVLARPCVLIAAHRNGASTSRNQTLLFNTITSNAETKLKYKFKKISPLTSDEMLHKEKGYASFIQTDPSMKSPFFIGLYYLDKEFKHLPDYVDQAFKGIYRNEEYKALGYIAFCHLYGGTTLPKVFINKIMGISPGKSYLDINPNAKCILYVSQANGRTVSYQSKHVLISQYVLDLCSKKLYEDGYKNMLVRWSDQFIDDIAKELKREFQENYKTILEKIYTRTKTTTGDLDDFSMLINDISIPEYRVHTLSKLAETVAQIALLYDPGQTPAAYTAAAHYYGHLGRLYSKGGSISLNYSKAIECCKKALGYLEKCNYQDYSIYHMYGDVKRLALNEKLHSILRYDLDVSIEDFKEIEAEIEDILRQYEISDEYGNHAYAQSTSILLLIDYLEFVYKKRGIDCLEKMNLLSESQANYKMKIEDIFDSLDWDYLDDKEKEMFNSLHDRYESGVMYRDYSHMEVHHQNKLDYLLAHQGSSADICRHRSRLILAKMAKIKKELPNGKVSYINVAKKDINAILALLEQSFEQTIDTTKYKDRKNRCNEYKRWMSLAKFSDRSIEKGIILVKDWISLTEKGGDRDPLPYYYLSVLYYLSALEGNVDNVTQAQYYSKQACDKASGKTVSISRIRDIFVDGKGIGQLCDISILKDIGTLESYENIVPMVLSGKFDKVESARGTVLLRSPVQWLNCKAKFTIRENNNLTNDFLTHMVSFYGGFGYEGIVAINSSVRDVTAKEVLPSVKIVKQSKSTTDDGRITKTVKEPAVSQQSLITDFFPRKIVYLDNGDFIIQGDLLDDKQGGLHEKNLPKNKEGFSDAHSFAEFIVKLEKIKAVCEGPDEKGRYRIKLSDEDTSISEMEDYGSEKTIIQDKGSEIDLNNEVSDVVNQSTIDLLPPISGTVVFYDIKPGNNCVTGKIQFKGSEYTGKITSNVSPKKIRKWLKKKRIQVKVISSTTKDYIVLPVE